MRGATERTANCLSKLERMNKALHHEEPDRVPVGDSFWGSFLERWWEEKGLPDEGIAPGTRWEDVPMNWTCPECGARKEDFEMVEI